MMTSFRLLSLLVALIRLDWGNELVAADYVTDVKPLLAKKCIACHGPVRQEAGLRLDAAALIRQGSESGPVALPEEVEESLLLHRVTAAVEERMPPEGEGEPLTKAQVQLLRDWIAAGLPAPEHETILQSPLDHWAFRPLRRPPVPMPAEGEGMGHPIDAFLAEARRRASGSDSPGVQPVKEAAFEQVLRRLYFDLIGLPPSRGQLLAYRTEVQRGDRPLSDVYRQVADELLNSTPYGERWARHWMDVWRYSDWDGYKAELRGSQRHIWRWRDWIVESLNADKGYDQMILEMLAGDEIAPGDPATLRATGFLARQHYKFNRDLWLDNCVEHTCKAFLALTVNCAKCHDHKYDPIPQADYYHLRAFFEPYGVRIDRVPGESDPLKDGLARAFDEDLAAVTYLYERGNEKKPDKEHPLGPALPELFERSIAVEPVPLPPAAWYPAVQEFYGEEALAAARAKLEQSRKKLAGAADDQSRGQAEAAVEVAQLELRWVEARVAADRAVASLGIEAPERTELAVAAAQLEREFELRQAQLALENARLALEALGEPDADKARVDKAKKEFEQAQKDLEQARQNAEKSDAEYTPLGPVYPRTSSGRRLALAQWIASGDNPLTARVAVNHIWLRHFGSPLVEEVFDFGLRAPQPELVDLLDWLAVEFVESGWSMKHLHRLMVTAQAYRLESSPPARDPNVARNIQVDPDNRLYWRGNTRRLEAEAVRDALLTVAGTLDPTVGGPDIDFKLGEQLPRRSLYFRHAYEKQMEMMLVFDAASPNECYRRTESIVPQQALALFNSEMSVREAHAAAQRITDELDRNETIDDEQYVTAAFEHLLTRSPTPDELAACASFLRGAGEGELAHQRAALVHVLMNHNDFITLR